MINPFDNWRSDAKPQFLSTPVKPQVEGLKCSSDLQTEVKAHCLQQYQKAMQLMEHSVADLSLQYVSKNPSTGPVPFEDKFRKNDNMKSKNKTGALLHFANAYCQRYIDLYEAYIEWEMSEKIPMIPVTAGQMKLHGFTSEDIIKMKDDCAKYTEISDEIKTILNGDLVAYEKVITAMTGLSKDISLTEFINEAPKRDKFLATFYPDPMKIGSLLVNQFKLYESLPQKAMLDKAHFLMHDFGHMEYPDIAMQLFYVGRMKPQSYEKNQKQERILMEIRHRIGGDMSIHQNSPGTLGGNPTAYLNMLQNGEPGNPEAEFREKMYFVYMNNHFSNAVIRDSRSIDFINIWLEKNKKGWELDSEFINAMNNRGPKYIPPMFRYGANAALNKQLREIRSHDEVEQFYKENPNISVKEVMEGLATMNAYYRLKLSDRELFNQIGELYWNPKDPNRPTMQLNYGTGAAVFKLYENVLPSMSDSAKEYLNAINDLSIPVFAGISGTLDQSTAMAGLVGLGVDTDLKRRELELETIKLAYLAFMLPGRDHSAHEILQSSTSFGLDYVAGPGYQQYLYPPDQAYILEQIKREQERRGINLPEYYLSAEYAEIAMNNIIQKKSRINVDVQNPSPVIHSPQKVNHYIGISLAQTDMATDLKEILTTDNSITKVNSHDLHITLGWLEAELTLEKKQEMAKLLQPILAKYADLVFGMKDIQLWNEGKDVIVVLNDDSNQLQAMREEMKTALERIKIPFEFHDVPHVKIAYSEQPKKWEDIEPNIPKLPSRTYSFSHCSLMHFDPLKWKNANDYHYGFKNYAEEQLNRIKKLHVRASKYDTRKKALIKQYDLLEAPKASNINPQVQPVPIETGAGAQVESDISEKSTKVKREDKYTK